MGIQPMTIWLVAWWCHFTSFPTIEMEWWSPMTNDEHILFRWWLNQAVCFGFILACYWIWTRGYSISRRKSRRPPWFAGSRLGPRATCSVLDTHMMSLSLNPSKSLGLPSSPFWKTIAAFRDSPAVYVPWLSSTSGAFASAAFADWPMASMCRGWWDVGDHRPVSLCSVWTGFECHLGDPPPCT